jgi:chromosome segregation ATPase
VVVDTQQPPQSTSEHETNKSYEKELQEKERNENRLENQIQQLEETIRRLHTEMGRKDTQLELQRERLDKLIASMVTLIFVHCLTTSGAEQKRKQQSCGEEQ